MKFLVKIICLFVSCGLVCPPQLWAQQFNGQSVISQMLKDTSNSLGQAPTPTSQSQYRFAPITDPTLMAVHVMGSVRKPGIHYLPPKSNLIEVLTLAGGTTENAEIDSIQITPLRAQTQNDPHYGKFNLEEHFENINEGKLNLNVPVLRTNDVVYVPEDKPFIDRDTATTVALVGTLTSILLSIIIIRKEVKGP